MDGCAQCFGGTAEEAEQAHATFARVANLVDESHFGIQLRSCASCGQRFVQVFCERVDWVNGEDPQTWAVLPISAEEAESLARLGEGASERDVEALATGRRYLFIDSPSEGPQVVRWSTGQLILPPHD